MADGHYHSDAPLTYSSEKTLPMLSVVTVPLRNRTVTGFVIGETSRPPFRVKEIKAALGDAPLPYHCLQLAEWMQNYYRSTLAEALRQFAPAKPSVRRKADQGGPMTPDPQMEMELPLKPEQKKAIRDILRKPSTTVLLHGDTGSGKTRVYMELAKQTLQSGRSVILLTPEISLTSQLARTAKRHLKGPVYVLHSQLSEANRKKIWFEILESDKPMTVIGPRSVLFSPLRAVGLIVLDEAHEPAYKQDQAPYYHAARVASQLGGLTGAKVVLGTATPSVTDFWLANQKEAVVRLGNSLSNDKVATAVIDLKDRSNFRRSTHLSDQLIDAIKSTLIDKKQIMIYLNRRGSARLILCRICSWHYFCPNCDVPLVYHGDEHLARCHTCGFAKAPPVACPKCNNPEIIYKTVGTKALIEEVKRLFPEARTQRFDSDNVAGEHLNELYHEVLTGRIDILVGTQLLAKGLDLPKLGLVGIITAEASLSLPDYTAEERTFQLLYQVIGRVGRGHGKGAVFIQSYDPENIVVRSASERDWDTFYRHAIIERRQFRFPPFSHLLQMTCKRATAAGAERASERLKKQLMAQSANQRIAVEIIGPTPSFYARRGKNHYYQLVARSKNREHLLAIAKQVSPDWQVNLDPIDLL